MRYKGPLIEPSLVRHFMKELGLTEEESKQYLFNLAATGQHSKFRSKE